MRSVAIVASAAPTDRALSASLRPPNGCAGTPSCSTTGCVEEHVGDFYETAQQTIPEHWPEKLDARLP